MKIGVFGGTFNPIHNGHISLAEQLLGKGILDKVLFMVSARPPHKDEPQVTAEQRLEMVKLALLDKENMEACDLEFKRPGNSYTVDTMAEIRELYREDTVFFVLGADSFVQLPQWKEPERLFKEISFIVSDRSCAFEDAEYQKKVAGIMEKYQPNVQFFSLVTPDVSSTALRAGDNTEHLPEQVLAYIKRNKLYE